MNCQICSKLELKVIPVVVFIVNVIFMLLCAWLLPAFAISGWWRLVVGALCILTGVIVILLSIYTFKKAKTPKTPQNPQVATQLVTWGIYAISRNPMYLGGTFIALGVALYIGNYLALFFAFLFMLYIDRFQIRPEERILKEKFPQAFLAYSKKIRRWL